MVTNVPRPKSNHRQMSGETHQKLNSFQERHIGPSSSDIQQILEVLGDSTLDQLIDQAVPQAIRLSHSLELPEAQTEYAALAKLKRENPHLKTLISIGGGSGSAEFPVLAADAQARQRFAQAVRAFVDAHEFDGVDGLPTGLPSLEVSQGLTCGS